jgi:hypothetical protein
MGMTKEQAEKFNDSNMPGGARYPYLADSKKPVAGIFRLAVEELKTFKGQKKTDRFDKYVVTFQVRESTNPDRKVGDRVGCYWCPEKREYPSYDMAEINQLVAAIGGEVTKPPVEDLIKAFGDDNPCSGLEVMAEVYVDPKGYAKVRYYPIEE